MDPRRLLIPALAGLGLSACAAAHGPDLDIPPAPPATSPTVAFEPTDTDDPGASTPPPSLPAPSHGIAGASPSRPSANEAEAAPAVIEDILEGPQAPAEDTVVGGVQLFAWSPGRVYPVRTAPLRVTTLTLGPGETLMAKAAGDTVRWQIGETTSGEGSAARAHVLIKPLERGLATNLVLTTSRRVYLLDLSSGGVDGFNPAVAWDADALDAPPPPAPPPTRPEPRRVPDPVVTPQGPLDARYRIEPQGRRARWTPTAVFNDGRRTFVAFDAALRLDEAPALFVISPDGEAQMVNYRQAGGLFIVDRLFDRAELRLGDRRPQVVRIRRLTADRR